jgi:hypothetical protein
MCRIEAGVGNGTHHRKIGRGCPFWVCFRLCLFFLPERILAPAMLGIWRSLGGGGLHGGYSVALVGLYRWGAQASNYTLFRQIVNEYAKIDP